MKINIVNMINQAAGQIKDDKAGYGYTLTIPQKLSLTDLTGR